MPNRFTLIAAFQRIKAMPHLDQTASQGNHGRDLKWQDNRDDVHRCFYAAPHGQTVAFCGRQAQGICAGQGMLDLGQTGFLNEVAGNRGVPNIGCSEPFSHPLLDSGLSAFADSSNQIAGHFRGIEEFIRHVRAIFKLAKPLAVRCFRGIDDHGADRRQRLRCDEVQFQRVRRISP